MLKTQNFTNLPQPRSPGVAFDLTKNTSVVCQALTPLDQFLCQPLITPSRVPHSKSRFRLTMSQCAWLASRSTPRQHRFPGHQTTNLWAVLTDADEFLSPRRLPNKRP